MPFLPFFVVLIAGVCIATQAPTNAALARASGSVVLAALVSFAVGTLVLFILWALADRTSPGTLRGVPAWSWMGGVYGACFVMAFAYAAPRIGLGTALTFAIAAQIVTALILDNGGLLGLRTIPVTPTKLAGLALVVGGVFLVRRG